MEYAFIILFDETFVSDPYGTSASHMYKRYVETCTVIIQIVKCVHNHVVNIKLDCQCELVTIV